MSVVSLPYNSDCRASVVGNFLDSSGTLLEYYLEPQYVSTMLDALKIIAFGTALNIFFGPHTVGISAWLAICLGIVNSLAVLCLVVGYVLADYKRHMFP